MYRLKIFLFILFVPFFRGNCFVKLPNVYEKHIQSFYFQPSDSFFISLENHWLQALRQYDAIYLNKLLSPDFLDISYKGEVKTKKDILSRSVYDNNNMEEKLTDIKARQYKNTAIVTGTNTIVIKNINQKILIRFTDVFVKKENEWHAVSAQETLVK